MKKTLGYVITGVLAVILIAVIVLAIVPSSFYNPIEKDDLKRVEVWHGGDKVYGLDMSNEEQKTIIDNILEKNANGYNEKILSALFLGYYGNDPTVTHKSSTGSETIENILTSNANNYYLIFDYTYGAVDLDEAMKTLKVNGTEYKLKDVEDETKATVKYSRMIMEITDSKDFGSITIYLEETNEPTTSLKKLVSNYRLSVQGYTIDLYNFLETLCAD